ncbi:P-loop containing nucleoside triphosphate hydrolase protein [Suillus discolor]|uniref:P-loop containing nucleoside triphosphate hydrolase protein n=1 Tax=Suillus discolor TaxID=1912936 RepID=A0A9P7EW37_9AGAM|nr:P-loop containing nucleoside triphosphate hydrolase protein [Suillus discolor]KAG2091857.1 P-loop containing nucleoside triphosphate hydrolase protein [Suillus discolor]
MSSPARAQPSSSSISSQCVVICGEAGSGKSSLVNLIAGRNIAVTSCDAGGCTAETNMYDDLMIRNETLKVKLVDTAGLDEGPRGTVPDTEARRMLKKLLRTLTKQGDIHLIMYCVRGEREIRTLRRNYELIRSQVKRKVPIVLVVTCLESYQPEMEDWWRVNEPTISHHGMTFAGHACITTATMTGPMCVQRRTHSYDAVCKLIEQCRPSSDAGVHTGLSPGTIHPIHSTKPATNTNVVIFGQTGAGKSLLVNLMAGEDVAKTSSDLERCTTKWQEHLIKFDGGSYNIFDTVGLQESQSQTLQYLNAVEDTHSLIQKLKRQGGIDLLIFCVRACRLTTTLRSNYRLFNEFLCGKNVPIVMVITYLENEDGEMDAWWKRNKKTLRHHEFDVDGHACITALRSDCPKRYERYEQSRTTIRKLVKEFTADGRKKRECRGGDDSLVSSRQKLKKLPSENSRSKDIVLYLTKRCGLSPDVAKQLVDRIKKGAVEGAT